MGQSCQTSVKFIVALKKFRVPFSMAKMFKFVLIQSYREKFTFSAGAPPIKDTAWPRSTLEPPLVTVKTSRERNAKVRRFGEKLRNFFRDVSNACTLTRRNANFRFLPLVLILKITLAPGMPASSVQRMRYRESSREFDSVRI